MIARLAIAFPLALAVLAASPVPRARAIDLLDGRVSVSGYAETQVRTFNPNFANDWDLSQWRQILNLEAELEILREPIGFLDEMSAFVRVEGSYDCVWRRACGISRSADAYGNRAGKFPEYYTDGRRNGFVGDDPAVNPVKPITPYHQAPPINSTFPPPAQEPTSRLVGIGDTPPFDILGRNVSFNTAFAPLLDYQFAVRQNRVTTSGGDSAGLDATVMPVRPEDKVIPLGSLASVANVSLPALPYRPALPALPIAGSKLQPEGLFHPSAALRRLRNEGQIDHFQQNFTESELAFNQGASQDESVLREAYLDLELFDYRLFLRVGKQNIVWGKTELFRNQDLFNPEDLALSSLPSLEESRIPQWALRGIYSFYNVGPLEDVRLEVAWIFDDFEPNDVGRCGEPYSPMPVCNKTFGLIEHGALGVGLAGETRPPDPWDSLKGHEIGARLEFRWRRFSFAISDFWHFEDFGHARIFNSFERRVDPESGRPLSAEAPEGARCITGLEMGCLDPLLPGGDPSTPDNAFAFTSLNRQAFDVICASSVGFFSLDPSVCALTVTNSPLPIGPTTLTSVISALAAGNGVAATLIGALAPSPPVVTLNPDDGDGPGSGFFAGIGTATLGATLTDQQEALLGCGAFYTTDCDLDGVDLFNTEASVIFEGWPGVQPGAPVATRFVDGSTVMLPGSRGPTDPGWDPLVDGCVGSMLALGLPVSLDPGGVCDDSTLLIDPRSGSPFRSELTALSLNALNFVVALDLADPATPASCGFSTAADPTAPLTCPTVQDFLSVTATTRPTVRAGGNDSMGRRDFAWAGAGELVLEYNKVNTLGFAMDFAEDLTATAWGIEFTWTEDRVFQNSESPDFLSESDVYALTLSVDRPTFIRFLNPARTFFFNMQWFVEYIPDHVGGGGRLGKRGFAVEGPWTALGTFTVQTGYFQDRLLPTLTTVYDVRTRSGALLPRLLYRFTSNFQVEIGLNLFWGRKHGWRLPLGLGAIGESNQSHDTERYPRLTAIQERDELFLRLRYSF